MEAEGGVQAAEAFAEGFFQVIEALLSVPVRYSVGTPEVTDATGLNTLSGTFPLVLHGTLRGQSPILLVLTMKDALRLAGTVFGNTGKDPGRFAEHDLAALKELGGHAIGGGVATLNERFGESLVLEEVRASSSGVSSAFRPGLASDTRWAVTPLRFQAGNESEPAGEARLLLSEGLAAVFGESPAIRENGGPGRAVESTQGAAEPPARTVPEKERTGMPEAERPGGKPRELNTTNSNNLDMILDIRLVVKARLGRVEMPINEILALGPGSIIEVGHLVDEPVDLLVNDKLIARGDVVVVDEKFGLRITEIISPRERIESLR